MSNVKKLMMTAASAGEALNVEDVFSTYLYKGTSAARGINNGIALADGVGGGTSTEFDGSSDYLLRTTDFSNTQGSKTFTISFWVYDNIGTAGTSRTIYFIFDGSTYYSFQVYFLSTDGYLRITGRNSSGTVILDQKITTVVRKKDQWLHVLMSFDLSDSSKRHYAVNDVVGTPSNTTYTNDTIAFSNGSPQHSIAGSFTGGTLHDGNLAHFYMDYTYRDLTVASNRRLFIDANGGSTSPSTLSALNPVIYLPMTDGYSVGENIGTGGDLTAYGSPTIVDSGTEYLSGVGQGGLVWTKNRSATAHHRLFDTERGVNESLATNITNAEVTLANSVTAFNSNGFSLGSSPVSNTSGNDYISWTFRKAPKFFDVVTYTGTGSARTVSHNLGSVPGCIIIKCTSLGSTSWFVYHKGAGAGKFGYLNTTNSWYSNTSIWQNTTPTSTQFYLGTGDGINGSSQTYVAYIFADNDGDGEFGPTGDQDIIKCGSYTGNGSSQSINLGWEPQWILIKDFSSSGDWRIVDNMTGLGVVNVDEPSLMPHYSNGTLEFQQMDPTATGFDLTSSDGTINNSGTNYIYVAIRRGPMAVPESATDVFEAAYQNSVGTSPAWTSGFPVDMSIDKNIGGGSTDEWAVGSRLTQGKYFYQIATSNEGTWSAMAYDFMDGWRETANNGPTDFSWMWRRAPNFFDVVAYKGNSTAGRSINHNLGVAPEMMWVKRRDNYHGAQGWVVYHKNLDATNPAHKYLRLNTDDGVFDDDGKWNDTAPTDSVFTVGNHTDINNVNGYYIAYLFATLDGIAKVGSYTGNGSSQTINCGFSSGARFVLIKDLAANGEWQVYDSVRGIVAGNDALLQIGLTAAEIKSYDLIDPVSSGFAVNNVAGAYNINLSGSTYIYYAIA
jgi:hypothetical protein